MRKLWKAILHFFRDREAEYIEEYLAKSHDLVDLERRMKIIDKKLQRF